MLAVEFKVTSGQFKPAHGHIGNRTRGLSNEYVGGESPHPRGRPRP
jgi:hypothetical protein